MFLKRFVKMKKKFMLVLGDIFRLLAVLLGVWSVFYVGFYECLVVGIWQIAVAIDTMDKMKAVWALVNIGLCPFVMGIGIIATRLTTELADYFYRQSNEN